MSGLVENYRKYGLPPFRIVVLHGGPGAPGEMAPVARELSSLGGVLEPLQIVPSLGEQMVELHNILVYETSLPVILIGWSWGAMFGYLFASRYPSFVRKLILVSSGVFEEQYAAKIMETRLSRLNEAEREQVTALMSSLENPLSDHKDALLDQLGKLIFKADSYDSLPDEDEIIQCNYAAYRDVWQQASEMRKSGLLLQSGKHITCPVVAVHGVYDPHPAEGIKEPLSRVLQNFRFILLEKCGHHPWLEKEAKDEFYRVLKSEIIL